VGRKSKRVLITGAGGLVGQVLRKELGETFDVVGVDTRRRVRGIRRADMTRQRQADRVLDGVDVVIDLASSHWQKPWDLVLRNNIPAAWTTLEAARRQGVRRVVYASSNHVTGLYERDEPYASILAGNYEGLDPSTVPTISATVPVRPDSPYGVGKVLGEAAARYYAEEHGLSVVCLRIGSLNRVSRPTTARHFATLITHRDMATLARCCIEAPLGLSFGVYYGVSANTWRIWDLAEVTSALGYEPQDDAEQWRPSVESDASLRSGRH
jgi:uronate dehydrogenase